MPSYTIVTPDENEHGVTSAREAYNASQPQTVADPTNPEVQIPNPALMADNTAYMTFVMVSATNSYCNQYPEGASALVAPAKKGAKA